MTDIIFIRGLRIPTKIGIYDWEQAIDQTLILDLEITAKPTADGMIVDYAAISTQLIDFIGNNQFKLIETAAEQTAEILFNMFHATWFRLSISKQGAVAAAEAVGICIERGLR
ncbi:MAG: dihydroneopterin aldolase [Gammaproteobacteria bacterium]